VLRSALAAVPPSSAEYNVKAESQDPNSILSFYKRLLALRRSEPALRNGKYLPLDQDNPYVLSFLRKAPGNGDSILVVLNMSAEPRTVRFALDARGVRETSASRYFPFRRLSEETVLTHFTVPRSEFLSDRSAEGLSWAWRWRFRNKAFRKIEDGY